MNIKTTRPYDWVIEGLSILSLCWAFVPTLLKGELKEGALVPTHYNLYGEVNSWGDPSKLTILLVIAVVIYVVLSLVQQNPTKFNYPIKVTEKNAQQLYCLGVQLVRYTKLLTILIFAYIINNSFAIALGKDTLQYGMPILFGVLFIVLTLFCLKMYMLKDDEVDK